MARLCSAYCRKGEEAYVCRLLADHLDRHEAPVPNVPGATMRWRDSITYADGVHVGAFTSSQPEYDFLPVIEAGIDVAKSMSGLVGALEASGRHLARTEPPDGPAPPRRAITFTGVL